MRLRSVHAVAALVVLASAACRRNEIISGVSDSAFVGTMTELRRIQNDASLDSARRKSARDSVLQGRGLTPEELERAARALARDPDRATAVWREVDRRLSGQPGAPPPNPGAVVPAPGGRPPL